MYPKPSCPASAHSKERSSVGTLVMTKPATKGREVCKEPPRIDHSMAWKMFINRARNNLRVGTGVVLESLSKGSF